MMAGSSAESLTLKDAFTNWLSITALRHIPPDQKSVFRKLEKLELKIIRLEGHLEFNQACIRNKLLPTYTNINLHDGAARQEEFVLDFRRNLIERQIDEQKQDLSITKNQLDEARIKFHESITSPIRKEALLKFIDRSKHSTEEESRVKQHRKLCQMYGGNICLKQVRDSVVNLSDKLIPRDMQEIFSLGFNFHIQSKYDTLKTKVQIEKLFEDIKNKERNNILIVGDESSLKTDLEHYGLKTRHPNKNPLSQQQRTLIKEFNCDRSIVVRKADKSNVFVVLNRERYTSGIAEILSDDTKFKKIDADPTETIKKEINELISQVNNQTDQKLQKLIGHYEPGYIYANPKIHKSMQNPPYRPIISQIGTVTYEISKYINSLIVPYLPKQFQANSTYEFLSVLRDCNATGMIASLDVESLFTNVPVMDTIDIILNNTYEHSTMAPPRIPRNIMKHLLEICTTKTPFRNLDGDLFVQKEGVSMGSALGPTFANFYMCHLENKVLKDNRIPKPLLYIRYIDDICVVVNNFECLVMLKQALEDNSVLKFTFETEVKKSMPFLDVLITRNGTKFETSVFVKETNHGDCLNYESICPDRYKTGVVKSMLHRAFHISSSWHRFSCEVDRIKQLLTNNNFPMAVIDEMILKFLNKKLNSDFQRINQDKANFIELYYLNQMSANYKQDEKQLKEILNKNVSPANTDSKIKLTIYYKNRKLSNCLS